MKTPLIDCHSHSAYSGHGAGSVYDAVVQAQNLRLAVYAQTEHLTLPTSLDPGREDSMSPEVARSYVAELTSEKLRLQAEGSPLDLVCGIEADWLDGREEELARLCRPYEYVIGSIHFIDGLPLDNSDNMTLWETLGVDGVWEAYLNSMEDMIRHSGPIRCVGHMDLPKVFGSRPSFDMRDAFGDLIGLVKGSDLIVELNCAGWDKKAREQYPASGILELLACAGVPCTVGCDAHKPEGIANHVEQAYRVLYDAGYRKVAAPTSTGDIRFFELA